MAACINSLFLFLSSIPRYGCASLFNHFHVEGHLGLPQFLAIMNKDGINICVQVLV